jgi:N-acetylmuramoyl-L-alanine amidase
LKIGRVVLDPGHGGHDTGTIGPSGLQEKELALDVCLRLGELIQSRLGAEVVFTRTDDTFIPLERRTAIANEQKADLFLSVHANSAPVTSSSGVESYYLNFTDNKVSMEVAARENASSEKTVFELKDLISRIARQEKKDESREFAERVQNGLYKAARRGNSRTRNRGVRTAPFIVLIGAEMPSVLAEIAFISNPRDEGLLKTPAARQRIAEGLYQGISGYVATLSHFEIAKTAAQE